MTLLKLWARAILGYSSQIHFTEDINQDMNSIDILKKSASEFLVVRGGKILKSDVIKSFNGAWINIHGGILPNYRGLDSHLWAAARRDFSNIGVTAHILTEKIDQGPILLMKKVECTPSMYLQTISNRLKKTAMSLHLEIHETELQNLKDRCFAPTSAGEYFGQFPTRPWPWARLMDLVA